MAKPMPKPTSKAMSKKPSKSLMQVLKSPDALRIAGVSLVALLAVGAIVGIAYQTAPAATAAPAAKAVTTASTAPAPATAPAKKTTSVVKTKNTTAAANGTAAQQPSEPVTITGCLEQSHDEFRLKDTSGADAPQSRSWKSGFLKKHSKTLTVVDATSRLKLQDHLGERVALTGTLDENDLQVRGLQRVAETCN